jgi:ATP-dependent DNA helicase DinG
VRQQVLARARSAGGPYGLETDKAPPVDGLIDAAGALDAALDALREPLAALSGRLRAMIDEGADKLDTPTRLRIEGALRSLERRAKIPIIGWRSMIETLAGETPEEFVDWFSIDREAGRETDVGMHRHWIDPTVPFIRLLARPAHGVVVTSASLRDGTGDNEADWRAAEIATGASHLAGRPMRAWVPSPFDYARQTRIFVVSDVARDDAEAVAAAYRVLFAASGGGGLGLFTSISRLRAVHGRIAPALDEAGVTLYAQHVDELDTTTLVDIFRAEENSCLLGTDAVRDGVDVPGKSLRLIVFDRVPWPRPDIVHRARRAAFGGRAYDEMITRLRLKQAYGRLVRRADDRGVFVMLDRAMPSRFNGAFPEGAVVERTGLADAADRITEFLGSDAP